MFVTPENQQLLSDVFASLCREFPDNSDAGNVLQQLVALVIQLDIVAVIDGGVLVESICLAIQSRGSQAFFAPCCARVYATCRLSLTQALTIGEMKSIGALLNTLATSHRGIRQFLSSHASGCVGLIVRVLGGFLETTVESSGEPPRQVDEDSTCAVEEDDSFGVLKARVLSPTDAEKYILKVTLGSKIFISNYTDEVYEEFMRCLLLLLQPWTDSWERYGCPCKSEAGCMRCDPCDLIAKVHGVQFLLRLLIAKRVLVASNNLGLGYFIEASGLNAPRITLMAIEVLKIISSNGLCRLDMLRHASWDLWWLSWLIARSEPGALLPIGPAADVTITTLTMLGHLCAEAVVKEFLLDRRTYILVLFSYIDPQRPVMFQRAALFIISRLVEDPRIAKDRLFQEMINPLIAHSSATSGTLERRQRLISFINDALRSTPALIKRLKMHEIVPVLEEQICLSGSAGAGYELLYLLCWSSLDNASWLALNAFCHGDVQALLKLFVRFDAALDMRDGIQQLGVDFSRVLTQVTSDLIVAIRMADAAVVATCAEFMCIVLRPRADGSRSMTASKVASALSGRSILEAVLRDLHRCDALVHVLLRCVASICLGDTTRAEVAAKTIVQGPSSRSEALKGAQRLCRERQLVYNAKRVVCCSSCSGSSKAQLLFALVEVVDSDIAACAAISRLPTGDTNHILEAVLCRLADDQGDVTAELLIAGFRFVISIVETARDDEESTIAIQLLCDFVLVPEGKTLAITYPVVISRLSSWLQKRDPKLVAAAASAIKHLVVIPVGFDRTAEQAILSAVAHAFFVSHYPTPDSIHNVHQFRSTRVVKCTGRVLIADKARGSEHAFVILHFVVRDSTHQSLREFQSRHILRPSISNEGFEHTILLEDEAAFVTCETVVRLDGLNPPRRNNRRRSSVTCKTSLFLDLNTPSAFAIVDGHAHTIQVEMIQSDHILDTNALGLLGRVLAHPDSPRQVVQEVATVVAQLSKSHAIFCDDALVRLKWHVLAALDATWQDPRRLNAQGMDLTCLNALTQWFWQGKVSVSHFRKSAPHVLDLVRWMRSCAFIEKPVSPNPTQDNQGVKHTPTLSSSCFLSALMEWIAVMEVDLLTENCINTLFVENADVLLAMCTQFYPQRSAVASFFMLAATVVRVNRVHCEVFARKHVVKTLFQLLTGAIADIRDENTAYAAETLQFAARVAAKISRSDIAADKFLRHNGLVFMGLIAFSIYSSVTWSTTTFPTAAAENLVLACAFLCEAHDKSRPVQWFAERPSANALSAIEILVLFLGRSGDLSTEAPTSSIERTAATILRSLIERWPSRMEFEATLLHLVHQNDHVSRSSGAFRPAHAYFVRGLQRCIILTARDFYSDLNVVRRTYSAAISVSVRTGVTPLKCRNVFASFDRDYMSQAIKNPTADDGRTASWRAVAMKWSLPGTSARHDNLTDDGDQNLTSDAVVLEELHVALRFVLDHRLLVEALVENRKKALLRGITAANQNAKILVDLDASYYNDLFQQLHQLFTELPRFLQRMERLQSRRDSAETILNNLERLLKRITSKHELRGVTATGVGVTQDAKSYMDTFRVMKRDVTGALATALETPDAMDRISRAIVAAEYVWRRVVGPDSLATFMIGVKDTESLWVKIWGYLVMIRGFCRRPGSVVMAAWGKFYGALGKMMTIFSDDTQKPRNMSTNMLDEGEIKKKDSQLVLQVSSSDRRELAERYGVAMNDVVISDVPFTGLESLLDHYGFVSLGVKKAMSLLNIDELRDEVSTLMSVVRISSSHSNRFIRKMKIVMLFLAFWRQEDLERDLKNDAWRKAFDSSQERDDYFLSYHLHRAFSELLRVWMPENGTLGLSLWHWRAYSLGGGLICILLSTLCTLISASLYIRNQVMTTIVYVYIGSVFVLVAVSMVSITQKHFVLQERNRFRLQPIGLYYQNVLAVITILVDIVQLNSITFDPTINWNQSDQIPKLIQWLSETGIAQMRVEQVELKALLTGIVLFIWFFVLKCPNKFQESSPFLNRVVTKDLPFVLNSLLYMGFISIFFSFLSCIDCRGAYGYLFAKCDTSPDSPPFLLSHHNISCWTLSHTPYAFLGLWGITFFLPIGILAQGMSQVLFQEETVDIKYAPIVVLVSQLIKAMAATARAFFTFNPIALASLALVGNGVLFLLMVYLESASLWYIKLIKSGIFAASCWSALCAIREISHNR
ncbi:hypothetical protein Poli38472_010652 [Pythium oligandrum]|uniref:Uncharacterized protein n=1 Tax=Pythium oligandrum TaxID=41045 RepID=A0A8K1FA04_PYTOL|nr:hypothetical protein Poli38472_010652 [Pythium oligandrum]|eukprot:TMW55770.1 hypothetical protein Poli38472_010652 [Pythium oligandrum]